MYYYSHEDKLFDYYVHSPDVDKMIHSPFVYIITITSTILYIIELMMIFYFIKTSTYIFTTYLRQER